jgi:hypothetical protein
MTNFHILLTVHIFALHVSSISVHHHHQRHCFLKKETNDLQNMSYQLCFVICSILILLTYIFCKTLLFYYVKTSRLIVQLKKSKVVLLHAMEAHGGRGGIAPTHT